MARRRARGESRDFGGALKELMRFSKRYIPAIVIALILGVGGAICQIIGPDYLAI